ncbi:tyrosine-type recombinase/integrase [Candidatus Saccharibacteria bacterium]|nr:tyrosine-type recombinase/integrase [Candidatus Saccharibacteria bacterium]
MKVTEAFALYKNNYLLIRGSSRRILEGNDHVARTIVDAVGDKDIEFLDIDDVSAWVSSIRQRVQRDGEVVDRSPNTIRNDIIRLRVVLDYMRLRGHECLNPKLIPVPKREDSVRAFLTPGEVSQMIDSAYSLRNKLIISLLYSSGIRLSELISLDRDSIRDGRFQVVGKGKKARLCFIDDRTEALVAAYLSTRRDDNPALIVSSLYKERMTPTNVQLVVKNTALRAGITKHVTPHVLRHSFATDFILNNGGIRHLSIMMGHSSINTTAMYTHVADNELEYQYKKYHSVGVDKSCGQVEKRAYVLVDNALAASYN